ncbi:leucine-rich repeat-containing protein 14B isoform X1 [Rattus norvegicus]|uniref:leucine-rich repeat-containing protein 14B isoform X1 n=1 Tax=Rattus norvegicus TaxID=10116 RepID=UPI002FD7C5F0
MTTRASLPLSVLSPEAAAAKNSHKLHRLWEEPHGQHHSDTMRSLRFISAKALASHPQLVQENLDSIAYNLYPLLFKTSYLLEQADITRALLSHWPLEEFRLAVLLGPNIDHPEDLRDRACKACLEACMQGIADHVLRSGSNRLRVADFTGIQDVQAFDAPPTCAPDPEGEDLLLTSIAWELSQMNQLTELSVAFSTLTGKIQTLLSPLKTPLRVLDLANCALNHEDISFLANCNHTAHLEVLDLSGHNLVHLYPSTFFRLLSQAAQTLKVLTLEDCNITDSHVNMMILGLSPCSQLQQFKFLGNPLSGSALRRLFAALCELPRLRHIEFPVPKDCYPEGAIYPQDELSVSKFDQQKYDMIAEDLQAVLLRANREDIQASTPLFGSFDPDIHETSNELGTFLLQAFKTALENFSRALEQME